MALDQTFISSTRNLFHSLPKTLQHPTSSQFRTSLHFLSNPNRRRCFPLMSYSVDYKDQGYTHPKPQEIPWRKEICNSVNLIGIVGCPVEIKSLVSGKSVAWTRLAVRKSATETTWINLSFWDELAQVAFQHVKKGQQIYVSGRLSSDTVESDEGKQQTYYKVVVQQLNHVERRSPAAFNDRDSNFMKTENKFGNNTTNSTGSVEELWQAFFANPSEWWDNRNNKRNPKYPDFKHKDTGEALWVEGRNNPPWAKSQLDILDTRMGSFRDQVGGTSQVNHQFSNALGF